MNIWYNRRNGSLQWIKFLLNLAWLPANQIALTEKMKAGRTTILHRGDQERLKINQKSWILVFRWISFASCQFIQKK
jgi:hypothetical protein